MAQINKHYTEIKENYLFSDIAKRTAAYTAAHPEADIIRMGIGDVTLPLCDAVIQALHAAVDEMSRQESFHGYGPEQGYGFLKDAICDYYAKRNISILADEVFISDGAKSDLGNILDIFSTDNTVMVTDPVYPVYVDTNIMAGRKIIYAPANEANGFLPMPDESIDCDLIYLCSPNNPTGAAYTAAQLQVWVDYAKKHDSVILFDAAYEAFITDGKAARSIYEAEGAKDCAIEFCSFSKTAGFTGTRCGYTIVPLTLVRDQKPLQPFWLRRQTTKFNGVPYIVQKAAAAVFSEEGARQIRDNLDYYRENARTITDTLDDLGIWYTGGVHSPYIWLKCPKGMGSWEFFDFLLERANVVGTPGEGFGECGKGYFRLTAFSSHEKTKEAMRRLKNVFQK